MAWREGGYFPDSHLSAGAVAFGALALILAIRPPHYSLSTGALVALASLAGLAALTGISSTWSSAPDTALQDFLRDLVYLGIFGLGLLAAGSGRYSRHLVWGVLGVLVIIAGAGLISRLQPDWLDPGSSSTVFGDYRLSYPLGYWNALGATGAMAVVLGVGLAGDPRSPVALRALAAGAAVVAGTAAYLTFSRGAWLAFFVGLAVLLLMSAHRVSLFTSLAICTAGLLAAIGRLGALPALTDDPQAGSGVAAQGDSYLPFLAVVLLVVMSGQLLATGRWLAPDLREHLGRRGRVVGAGFAVLVSLAGAGFYVARSADVEGRAAANLLRAESWVDRQWGEFMAPAPVTETGTRRLTSARGTRSDLYRVAIDGFQAHPLWGDGSGGFEYRFAHDREVPEKVRDAHSLYLETLGELGLGGALLLLAFVGAAVWAAVAARLRGGALSGAQSAAATGAFAVWAGHAGMDWDWQLPALTAPALLLAAALYPRGRGRRRRAAAATGNAATVIALQPVRRLADDPGGRCM